MSMVEKVRTFAETVAPVFKANDWQWSWTRDRGMIVPGVVEISGTVWSLMCAVDDSFTDGGPEKEIAFASQGRIMVVGTRSRHRPESGTEYRFCLVP